GGPAVRGEDNYMHPLVSLSGAQRGERLMNLQRLFSDEDLELPELSEQGLFQLGDEAGAPPRAEVQGGDHDDLIEVDPGTALPDAAQRELALLRSQTAEPGEHAPF